MPEFPGQRGFRGELLHSKHYRDPEAYRDKTVLILGASFSGKDIVMDLANTSRKTYISHKSEKKLSFTLPDNTEEVPMIASFCSDGVLLVNGEYRQIDTMIFATGYLVEYPFLSAECGISVRDGRVEPLHKHIFNTKFPTMCLFGLCTPVIQFRVTDAQLRYACAVFRGDVALPAMSDMLEEEKSLCEARAAELLPKRIHRLIGHEQWDYVNGLAKEAGFPCAPVFMQKLYKNLLEQINSDFDTFKGKKFRILDQENFVQF